MEQDEIRQKALQSAVDILSPTTAKIIYKLEEIFELADQFARYIETGEYDHNESHL